MQIIYATGRVGGDAETRKAGQNDVTNFNLAVDQGWGQNKTTNWYRVAIWGDRGTKLAAYIKKGEKVAVSGELNIGEYNGKPQFEIRAHDIDCFMGGGVRPAQQSNDTGWTGQAPNAPSNDGWNYDDLSDEIPF